MANRQVLATRKGNDGDILALCNSGEYWSPVSKEIAIRDIENKDHSYFVIVSGMRVDVKVINDTRKGKYLRTDPDKTKGNNLDYLPDC